MPSLRGFHPNNSSYFFYQECFYDFYENNLHLERLLPDDLDYLGRNYSNSDEIIAIDRKTNRVEIYDLIAEENKQLDIDICSVLNPLIPVRSAYYH